MAKRWKMIRLSSETKKALDYIAKTNTASMDKIIGTMLEQGDIKKIKKSLEKYTKV